MPPGGGRGQIASEFQGVDIAWEAWRETVDVPLQEEKKKLNGRRRNIQTKVSKKVSAFFLKWQTLDSTVSLSDDATPTEKAYILSDVTATDGMSQKYANYPLLFPFSSERRILQLKLVFWLSGEGRRKKIALAAFSAFSHQQQRRNAEQRPLAPPVCLPPLDTKQLNANSCYLYLWTHLI